MAQRESEAPAVAIPKWFLGLVAALGIPIVTAAFAIYVQLAQLGERFEGQRVQLARIEASTTSATNTAGDALRATALITQTINEFRERGTRLETTAVDHDRRLRELELLCVPRGHAPR
jgi:hypothetical protein